MRSAVSACALLALALEGGSLAAKPFGGDGSREHHLVLFAGQAPRLRRALANIGLTDLWKDRRMRPFARGAQDLLAQAGELMQRKLGLKPADLLDLWQGELRLRDRRSRRHRLQQEGMPIALLIDVGERKEKARELIRKARGALEAPEARDGVSRRHHRHPGGPEKSRREGRRRRTRGQHDPVREGIRRRALEALPPGHPRGTGVRGAQVARRHPDFKFLRSGTGRTPGSSPTRI